MGEKEELKKMMQGIQEEIDELKRDQEKIPDSEARIKELEKEWKSLNQEIRD